MNNQAKQAQAFKINQRVVGTGLVLLMSLLIMFGGPTTSAQEPGVNEAQSQQLNATPQKVTSLEALAEAVRQDFIDAMKALLIEQQDPQTIEGIQVIISQEDQLLIIRFGDEGQYEYHIDGSKMSAAERYFNDPGMSQKEYRDALYDVYNEHQELIDALYREVRTEVYLERHKKYEDAKKKNPQDNKYR